MLGDADNSLEEDFDEERIDSEMLRDEERLSDSVMFADWDGPAVSVSSWVRLDVSTPPERVVDRVMVDEGDCEDERVKDGETEVL